MWYLRDRKEKTSEILQKEHGQNKRDMNLKVILLQKKHENASSV